MVGVGRRGSFQIVHVEPGVQIREERRGVPLHVRGGRVCFGRCIPEGDGALIFEGAQLARQESRDGRAQKFGFRMVLDQPERVLHEFGTVLRAAGPVRAAVVGH